MRPIEVLHLTFSFMPADPRVKREALAAAATGRRVAVICLRAADERPVERHGPVLIIRVPAAKSRGGFLRYSAEYLDFLWRCRRLVAGHRGLRGVRLVHVATLPDFLLWAALPARRRGAKLVLDMHEIFPEFTRARFGGLAGRLLGPLADTIERWARRTADLTVTVNRPIERLLASRPARPDEWRIVVHNTAAPSDFGDGAPGRPARGSDRAPRFIYHGTLTRMYGLDLAIEGIARARAAGVPASLAILGDGPERSALERQADTSAIAGAVTFERPIPHRELPQRLLACDAAIIPTRLDGMTRFSLSTKLLECVHLGLPVLAARLPSYEAYFDDEALWYWRPGDPADLAARIAEFVAAPAAARGDRARRAQAAIAELRWEVEGTRLMEAYARLLGQQPPAPKTEAMRSAAFPSP